MMRIASIIILFGLLISICSCGDGSKMDAQWQEIDRLCDSLPLEAMRRLDSIDQTGLSEKDLNRCRLLWIKSRDKAYITHTSDTLILDIVDYYACHRSEGLYPESLYYGGRVYSDLGDLPTALEFFQKSIDEIPEDDASPRFRITVLNQTGRLLNTLRLDSAAIEYLERSLQVDSINNAMPSEVAFTHGLIASSLLSQNNMKEARRHMDEAVRISSQLNESDRLTIQSEFAYMLFREGKIDSALMVIRPLPSSVDSITAPFCLAVAADIYRKAGIPDTAYMYARRLTRHNTPNNKKTGYKVIFSEEMKHYVPNDTLLRLMPEYKKVVEDYLDTHESEQAIIQATRYNYSTHIKERVRAEKELKSLKEKLWIGGSGVTIILLIVVSVILWRKYHKSRNDSQKMEGIMLSDKLRERLLPVASEINMANNSVSQAKEALDERQSILKDIKMARESNPSESVDKTLKASPLYKDLREKAENKNVMGRDVTWRMIEELIESVSPGFDNRLAILTEFQITTAERNVAYLMKFGFSQAQMASLMAKSASTISIQRTSLAKKIGYDKSAVAAILVRL